MKRTLITSALPYINGMKHLGNLAGSLLPADVYARFLRAEGEEVLFICATDDHGTPAEIGAFDAGLDVRTYCDVQHARQRDVYERFGLSFDHFGRTSSPQNRELTQRIHDQLEQHGFLEERVIHQVYSIDDQRFLPDRYVIGTCPHCGFDKARGDQCDGCTTLLDPVELIDARSLLSGSTRLEVRPTKHLFLKLDRLQDEVSRWVDAQPHWPQVTRSIAHKWLDEGLKDRCITRDLSWGIPVPRDGFDDKVFYVWFDAPIGYIGATAEWADQAPERRSWQDWWLDADDVRYVQFMGKDNVPFHTIFFPATLIGTRQAWTLATTIKAFHWLTYYGGRFSTSLKQGVFMDQALDLLPADYWRYFLTAQAPETDDTPFSWELFRAVVNKDLANTYGNFINRTLKLTEKYFGNEIPRGGNPGYVEAKLQTDCLKTLTNYRTHLRKLEFRQAVRDLKDLWALGNLYLEERQPWKQVEDNREQAAVTLRTTINLIRIFSLAAQPIIPFAAGRVLDALHLTKVERSTLLHDAHVLDVLPGGRRFEVIPPLFRRIDEAEVSTWKETYGDGS